jgi:hypothetical protein
MVWGETPAMHTNEQIPVSCSWACHNSTTYCIEHHIQHLTPYLEYTHIPYFAIIGGLKGTGNYTAANIYVLVILIPLLIWFFIIQSLSIQRKINTLKKPL